jgi:hypothetical protein
MNNKASSLKSSIEEFARRQGIDAEMDQNLVKEAIHLHLLSAMSDAGILRHAVFQGGTALRLCYGGDRYSEDLDFVCGKAGSYFTDVEFKELIESALETTKKTLNRDFGIAADQISLKKPPHPDLVKQAPITVAAWQIIVPIEATPRAPRSRIKIEFANVPAYETKPMPVRVTPGLVQVQDVILTVETPNEILADKAVALTARDALKFRDVWTYGSCRTSSMQRPSARSSRRNSPTTALRTWKRRRRSGWLSCPRKRPQTRFLTK